MDTIIIGISGKKQSGKSTLCESLFNYLESKCGKDSCSVYSFADSLKEKVCIDVLGLTREQCYGTDEQKNTSTIYSWGAIPKEISKGRLSTSFMTAREVMQIVGTDIFRKYFDDSIWVNATFRDINKDNYKFALISDVRFSSEVEGISNQDGSVIRLLRNVCETDSHASETSLDSYNWDSIENAHLINNIKMSIDEQFFEAKEIVESFINTMSMKKLLSEN